MGSPMNCPICNKVLFLRQFPTINSPLGKEFYYNCNNGPKRSEHYYINFDNSRLLILESILLFPKLNGSKIEYNYQILNLFSGCRIYDNFQSSMIEIPYISSNIRAYLSKDRIKKLFLLS